MPKLQQSGDPQETTCIFKKPENLKSRFIQNINFRRKSLLIVDNIKMPFQGNERFQGNKRPILRNPSTVRLALNNAVIYCLGKRLYSSMIDQMSKLTQLWFQFTGFQVTLVCLSDFKLNQYSKSVLMQCSVLSFKSTRRHMVNNDQLTSKRGSLPFHDLFHKYSYSQIL